ncbi:hypothetical protein WJX84_003958 [Apatococcus fuscideae]|uniref:RNA methyltransferase n=1 Tax=Apatococcus fuscideae TaxID=2026836 RepID=A0AAW1TAB9_9CHLO
MDIGCNDGRLTLTMASKYGCASMLGLDIDASLIKQACRALHRARATAREKRMQLMKPQHRQQGHASQSMSARRKAASTACQALSNTCFQAGDAVGHAGEPGTLDMVTCFSVTKWVHLNQAPALAVLPQCLQKEGQGGSRLSTAGGASDPA